jgi:hypothetical protein
MKALLCVSSSSFCIALLLVSIQDAAPAQVKKALPRDLPEPKAKVYRADPYILAATKLQALTKDEAYEALATVAEDKNQKNQVIVLCRMLFVRKPKGEFRGPLFGEACLLGGTAHADWPLEPIEVVNGVPFLISSGYWLIGVPESAKSYLDYCVENCDWNTERFEVKSKDEKRKALVSLLASPKWNRQLREGERSFLELQIK